MGRLRTLWSVVLLGGCAGLAYQGWQNSRVPHPADAEAEAMACGSLDACGGPEADWASLETSPFSRRYRLETKRGPLSIECRWSAVLFGSLRCVADREATPEPVSEQPARRPHEQGRGNRQRR